MKKNRFFKFIAGVIWLLVLVYVLFISLSYVERGAEEDSFLTDLLSFFKGNKYGRVETVISQKLVEEESATIDVVEKVSPAVVSIVVKRVDFDLFSGPSLIESGIGTGFIVDPNGLIVTNSHVVDDSRGEYSVVLKDGTTYEVDRIHLDSISDLAILEVTGRNLPTVVLGDSESLKVGQKAIAIGNALGRFQNTVTVGVISGIGRQVVAGGFGTRPSVQENAIQTDAALNPGNSGGPLLSSAGQVIGINVATTAGADNISFAIPVNTLKPLLEIFIEEGRIIRPYMGISYTIITEEIASLRNMPMGAYITGVFPDSPADKVGLQRGDIIMKLEGKEVNAEYSIARAVAQLKVGDEITLLVDRDGKQQEVALILEEAPEDFR